MERGGEGRSQDVWGLYIQGEVGRQARVDMESLGPVLAHCVHCVPEWLEMLFLVFCVGSLVCRLWVLDGNDGLEKETASKILKRLWLLFALSAAAMSIASGGDLLIRTGEMSGFPLLSSFPLLPMVIQRTHLGQVWLIRESAVLFLLLALLVGWRHRESRLLSRFLLCLLLVAAMTKSASGHAADAGDFTVSEWVDWLHLVATSFWAGGILVLSTVVLPLLSVLPHSEQATAAAAQRFSRIAGIAVGVVAATACYNGYSLVWSAEALVESPYGWIVIAKICLFLLAIGLGATNRYILIPLLEEHDRRALIDGTADVVLPIRPPKYRGFAWTQAKFAASVRAEAIAVLVLLFCAALLRHEVPARHYAAHAQGSPASVHHHQQ